MRPVLSFSLAALIHWFAQSYCEATNTTTTMLRLLLLYQFWLAEICICPTRDEMRNLQIAPPKMLMLLVFVYTSGTPHARHVRACFELWGRPFCSSFLSFFLPFGVAMKEIHSTQLCCHISFLSFIWLTTCFFIQPRTLDGFT